MEKEKRIKYFVKKNLLLGLIFFLTIIGLYGWFAGKIVFASFSLIYIPMAPATALIFIILGLSLFFLINFNQYKWINDLTKIFSLFILLFCFLIFLDFIFDFWWDLEYYFVKNPQILNKVTIGRMSPITSVLFILSCLNILLFNYRDIKIRRLLVDIFSLIVYITSFVIFIGYLYKAPLLYGGSIIPVSLPTSICFILLSTTFIRTIGLPFGLSDIGTVQYQLARTFIPLVSLIIILQGFINTDLFLHAQNPTLFSALVLFIAIILSVVLILYNSKRIEKKLKKADLKLKESQERYRTIFEQAPLGIALIHSHTGKIKNANPMYEKIVGRTIEELSTINWMKNDQ